MPSRSSLPIGLFDSGIGGLTVAQQVMSLMPHENIVYFGDTARVPYGSKSSETVIEYSLQAQGFLESIGVKMIIIACNTASSVALEAVRSVASVPVLGVIEPGATAASAATRSRIVGVIGTEGTIRSQAYQQALRHMLPDVTVLDRACPLFVSLAEEGYSHHEVTRIMAREYLQPMLARSIDTLILGCTHYPVLEPSIASIAGSGVTLINPAVATAELARATLESMDLLNASASLPRHTYYLSDFPHKFVEVGERFLGHRLEHVHRISLDQLTHE
ncbi:MAG TPA: glutamate racemase [Candidatus Kapabacteria bacterium]|jgi:glutamate racemase|nr:glutamate racemase [Candidatus Kapabacteria bacterium]